MTIKNRLFVGLDGEGQGRNPHRYVLLAVSDEEGLYQQYVEDYENPTGLTTLDCLNFLVSLPPNLLAFSYAFNYDLTMMLKDLPNDKLYYLFRPELRRHDDDREPEFIDWKGFELNLEGSRFEVRKAYKNGNYLKRKQSPPFIVWDIFKFYQSKFVDACRDWKVGTTEELDRMAFMKEKRAEFDKENPEAVRAYCFSECRNMAGLARKLTEAHVAAGLTLKSYHGAGSTASAILDKMGIKEKVKNQIGYCDEPAPKVMEYGVMCAFFGGRFENRVIGPIEQDIYSYDISSAYPYQITFLPCLEHGTWEYTTNRNALDAAKVALVWWFSMGAAKDAHWGPLPVRRSDGCILFPTAGAMGFTYLNEYLQAERLFGNVDMRGAWILRQECECQPFRDIPHYYRERCRIGKEGPGIVLKLGVNANYGKLAQSIGKAQYRSWIWAGMVTSGCRAQLLEALGCHRDRTNLLAVATDGIYSLERLELPKPVDTNTADTGKPLGGWEEKVVAGGMFLARPGINFPLAGTDPKLARGRGLGRKIVYDNTELIQEAWRRRYTEIELPNVVRFCGAKSSITRSLDGEPYRYKRADRYGQWIERDMKLGFSPLPKRRAINPDGSLEVWNFLELGVSVASHPYTQLEEIERIRYEFDVMLEEEVD